jgi:hypothetical protein
MYRRSEYMREYWRAHRYCLSAQRRARSLDRRAGVRPGGGCVKCELWRGCGGLWCEKGTPGESPF